MNLLLTGCFNYTEIYINELKSIGYKVYFMQHEAGELPLPANEIDAIVCNGLFIYHSFEDFKSLKFIQLTSAGLDRVPLEKICYNECELHNARGVYSIPMAEWALFRVLEYYKQGDFFRNEQQSCRWTKHRGLREIYGSKVAIIGVGNVGMEVAKRFHVMGAVITGFDIHTNATECFDRMLLTETLIEHIGEMDIVIVTAPLLPSTKGLISREILKSMKLNAILVNIARGGLINQQALIDVLKERTDLFAALDVFMEEPLEENSPLWRMDNVAISPHNSFVSEGNDKRLFKLIKTNLEDFYVRNNNK